MATQPERDDPSPGMHPLQLIHVIRLCGRLLAAHLAGCGHLIRVEWELEKRRLREVALLACACVFCLLLAAIYLITLSLSMVWESAHRDLFLCAFAGFFVLVAFFVWRRIAALSILGADRFAGVQHELAETLEVLRKHL